MRDKRRKLGYLALALAAVLACLELSHWGDVEISLVSENAERILRRTPAAGITETDRALVEDVSQCPNIQKLLDGEEGGSVYANEDGSVKSVAEAHLEADCAASLIVTTWNGEEGPVLIVNWSGGKERFLLQRTGSEDEESYFKVYARDGLFGRKAVYENWDNETVRQSSVHHDWFSWLAAD